MPASFTALVSSRGGVFTRAEAVAYGCSPAGIRWQLRTGTWHGVGPGLYVDGAVWAAAGSGTVAQEALRVRAWQLGYPDAVASCWTAAALHGLAVPAAPRPNALWLTRPPGRGHAARWQHDCHLDAAALPNGSVVQAHGVRTTSVDRTLVDLARRATFRDGVVMADAALRAEVTHFARLSEVAERYERWPGGRVASAVVAFADPRSESGLESRSRVFFHERRMDPPELQVWFGGDRADFYWEKYRTVGEADGLLKYRRRVEVDADAEEQDNALVEEKLRQERLEARGLQVVRWTWRQLHREPDRLEARIRAAWRRGLGTFSSGAPYAAGAVNTRL